MKLLKQIGSEIYDAGIDGCAEPADIEDDTEVLFIARFRAQESNVALEGFVLARGAGYTEVDFKLANDDGEAVSENHNVQIDSRGILGQLVLSGESTLRAKEGYFLRYAGQEDYTLLDELETLVEEDRQNRLPVLYTEGGAQADIGKRRMGFDGVNRELGI